MSAVIRIKQLRGRSGLTRRQRACLSGLGLRRIGHCVERQDTPAVRGMIRKLEWMLEVRE